MTARRRWVQLVNEPVTFFIWFTLPNTRERRIVWRLQQSGRHTWRACIHTHTDTNARTQTLSLVLIIHENNTHAQSKERTLIQHELGNTNNAVHITNEGES